MGDGGGLGPETLVFLKALGAHNSREWFEANRPDYEACVKRPAEAFATALTATLDAATGRSHRAKIFRIHRDVRFSRDKIPYHTYLHLSLTPLVGAAAPPAWMFGLEPGRLTLGAGVFSFPGAALDSWRARIAGPDGEALAGSLATLTASGARLEAAELKRVPAPYPADHIRGDLLRRKGLMVWLDLADASIAFGPDGARHCTAELMRLRPVFDWLEAGGD